MKITAYPLSFPKNWFNKTLFKMLRLCKYKQAFYVIFTTCKKLHNL
jgi:hypothetical protein